MKLFTRCRILANVFTGMAVVLALVLGFNLFELGDNLKLVSDDTNRWLLLFVAGCCLLLVLVLLIVTLRCIAKDAEEDLSAVMRLSEQSARKQPASGKNN